MQRLLRRLRLLQLVERVREPVAELWMRRANREFLTRNPDFAVPPAALAFDAYGRIDWQHYHDSGVRILAATSELIEAHCSDTEHRILEWGCGPGRVVRHLVNAFPPPHLVYGCDYNAESIAWARENIPGVHFELNELEPPLPFEDGSFDCVLALSVFTHLSERVGRDWMHELRRVVKPGGIIVFTAHGENESDVLGGDEVIDLREKGVVVRDGVPEGKKMYGAWFHPDYIKREWIDGMELLAHHGPGEQGLIPTQDAWCVRAPMVSSPTS
jgi:SAM-dependent methyltransferase